MRNGKWVIAAVAAVLGLVLVGSAARAGTPGTLAGNGSYVGGLTFPGPEPLMLWNLPGAPGKLGTCIDANVNGPLTGPYSKQSSISDPLYAELNHIYANPGTSDRQLAELSALNSVKFDLVDKSEQWGYVERGAGGMSTADTDAMLANARKLAGPYTLAVTWPARDTLADTPYTATIEVRAASGAGVPDAVVNVAGTYVDLAATTVRTNSTGAATVGFTIPPGTSSSIRIGASVAEWTTLDLYRSAAEQTMLVTGAPDTVHAQHSAAVSRSRDVHLVKVAVGDPDKTSVPGYTFSIKDSAGTVVLPKVTTPADLGALPLGRTYTATETGVPAGATLYIPSAASTRFTVTAGSGPLTVTFADPRRPTPAVRTQISTRQAVVGQSLSDTVIVSGDDGEDGTITARLFGPAPAPKSGECSDLKLADYQAAASIVVQAPVHGTAGGGNGAVQIAGPRITVPGCYGWAETLTLTPSQVVVTSPPTAPDESALVTTAMVTTTTSAQVALPGTRLHDHVVVTGLGSTPASLTATLYGPLPASPRTGCRALGTDAWRAAIAMKPLVVGSVGTTITGDASLDLGSVLVTRVGCYTWVETLTPRGDGATPVRTLPGQTTESSVVVAPTLGTVASPASLLVGHQLRDVIDVTGTAGVPAVITGRLLGPLAPVDGACTGLNWSTAPAAASIAPLRIDHDGRYRTAPVAISSAGCYTFSEVLLTVGPTPLILARTKPGVPVETALASPPHGPLAVTGLPITSWLSIGLALLALGCLFMATGALRRRMA